MGEIEGSAEPSPVDVLIADLKTNTDLAWLVERVARNHLPWVVVPAKALDAWAERDPVGWSKVSDWLAAKGVAVIRL